MRDERNGRGEVRSANLRWRWCELVQGEVDVGWERRQEREREWEGRRWRRAEEMGEIDREVGVAVLSRM